MDAVVGAGPLRPGVADFSHFPWRAWQAAARKALRTVAPDLGYGDACGLYALREAIAAHVRQFRGVGTDPENVIIVEGTQAALHLAAIVLAAPQDAVVIEDPCYTRARAVLEAHGLYLQAVPVDDHGISVEKLPDNAAFAYVTPSHQFPLGASLSLDRRQALLAWATARNAYIVEDDYDSEFMFTSRPLPALQSLDQNERVIYVGTFSKILAPTVRLGYLISPPHLADACRAVRACTSIGAGVHLQATVAEFIAEGHLARHVQRMKNVYASRRETLISTVSGYAGAPFRFGPAHAGLHLALIAPATFDDLAKSALPDGQRMVPLSRLSIWRRDCKGFVLGFTYADESAVATAAQHLMEACSLPERAVAL
jgi:GntR family transcriptional regulator/MocR family aminotransferase